MWPRSLDTLPAGLSWPLGLNDGVDVGSTKQAAEAVVAARLIGQQIDGLREALQLGNPAHSARDADKVREAGPDSRRLRAASGEACAEDSPDVDGSVSRKWCWRWRQREVASRAVKGAHGAGAICQVR